MPKPDALLCPEPERAARRVALAGMVGVAGLCTPAVLYRVADAQRFLFGRPLAMGWAVLTTCGLTWALGRLALRAKSTGGACAWLLVGGAVAGALNAGVCLAGISLVDGGPLQAAGHFLLATLVGGFVGAPLGAAYGLLFAPLARAAIRARAEGASHEAVEEARLVAAALVCAAAPVATYWPSLPTGAAVAAGAGAIGLGLAAQAVTRMRARRRLLATLAGEGVAGLALAPRRGGEDEARLRAFVPASALDGVLVRTPAEHPYRGGPGQEKLALAPLPPLPARAVAGLGRPLAASVAWLVGAAVCLALLFAAMSALGRSSGRGGPWVERDLPDEPIPAQASAR